MNYQNLTSAHLEFLTAVVGEEHISIKDSDLEQHSKDESFHGASRPSVVIWPGSAAEISSILRYANQQLVPVTP